MSGILQDSTGVKLRLICSSIVAAVALFATGCKQRAPIPDKVWSIDLASDEDFRQRLGVSEVLLDPPIIAFLNNGQLICSFYKGAKVGTGEEVVPNGFHVLEIAAVDGSFGNKLTFNGYETEYKALPVADGGFVVFAGDKLQKFNNQFEPGPSYSTARLQAGESFDRWRVDVSPTQNTVLVYSHQPGNGNATWTWLRTTDLAPVKSIEAPLVNTIQASDTAGMFDDPSARKIQQPTELRTVCSRCNAYFLTDDLLFLDKDDKYTIETVGGVSRASEPLGYGGLDFARSAHATRFAYMTGHYIGHGFLIQTNFDRVTSRIRVWDWSTNKVVGEIDVNEPIGNPSAGLSISALALSPDGRYLAVLLHHTLSLYRLP
jgi:hypothetical protein